MSEERAWSVRLRGLKTLCKEEELVEEVIPTSTKYKNKWALTVFSEWQFAQKMKVLILNPGGLFKDYDLHKVGTLSWHIKEMKMLSLNNWLSKFVMQVAKTDERYSVKTFITHNMRILFHKAHL